MSITEVAVPVDMLAVTTGPVLRFAYTADQIGEWMEQLQAYRKAVLILDDDYGVIPGTNKPTLYKSGAEKLLLAAGLGFRNDRVEDDEARDHRGVTYKCSVWRGHPENVIATVDGYAGYEESRFYISAADAEAKERSNAAHWKRPVKTDKFVEYRAPWNSVIKMAQKRSLVGATLNACAASGLFAQDLEDDAPAAPAPAAKLTPEQEKESWARENGWVNGMESLRATRRQVVAELKRRADEGMITAERMGVLVHDYDTPEGVSGPVAPRTHAEHLEWWEKNMTAAPELGETATTAPGESPAGPDAQPERDAVQEPLAAADSPQRPVATVPTGPVLATEPHASDYPYNGHTSELEKHLAKYGADGLRGRIDQTPDDVIVKQLQSRGVDRVSTGWTPEMCKALLGAIVLRNAIEAAQAAAQPGDGDPF